MVKTAKDPAEYILPLYMNGLSGRMLKVASQTKDKNREILFIAGQHTSAERIFGIVDYLSRYGHVTSPDLPGFGGMDNFYKIGEKPSLDNMADYLASYIKLRYRNRQLTIIAVSYGFAVVTRMLQRYPEILKKVELVVSISGVVNKKDFRWKRRNLIVSHSAAWLFSHSFPAFLARKITLRSPVIRTLYKIAENKHPKLRDAGKDERAERIDFEVILWKINDFRTWMYTCLTMFNLDLHGQHLSLPVYHVAVDDDHYFDNLVVEQHMRAIYNDFTLIMGQASAHVPTVIATAADAAHFIPPALRRLLNKKD